ncbi:hypothetical protein ACFLVM_02625, partial [Chloroflexota bacterium]
YDKGIFIPTYQSENGHPVIFSTKHKEELLRLKGDIGGMQIIKKRPNDVLKVTMDSKTINMDINTVSDYYSQLKLSNLK